MTETKRIQVYVSEQIYSYLEDKAKREGRKTGNLAAWVLSQAVENLIESDSRSAETR